MILAIFLGKLKDLSNFTEFSKNLFAKNWLKKNVIKRI